MGHGGYEIVYVVPSDTAKIKITGYKCHCTIITNHNDGLCPVCSSEYKPISESLTVQELLDYEYDEDNDLNDLYTSEDHSYVGMIIAYACEDAEDITDELNSYVDDWNKITESMLITDKKPRVMVFRFWD